MNKEEIERRFKEDCKKLGIEEFSFENAKGPWRELYFLRAAKKTPGKTNSREKVSRIGARLQQRRSEGETFKEACNALSAEIEEMRKSVQGLDAVYEGQLTPGAYKRILEDYRKLLRKATKNMEKMNYYDPMYKSTKVKKISTD
jgi:hypothetical protein